MALLSPIIDAIPGGLAYADGNLFMGGLLGQTLYRVELGEGIVMGIKSNLTEAIGRISTTG